MKQYQVDLDPSKLAAYDINFNMVVDAIKNSNRDVGVKVIESNDAQMYVRGQ